MGGECNYLLRVNPTTYRLEFVPEEAWQTPEMLSWDEDDIKVVHTTRILCQLSWLWCWAPTYKARAWLSCWPACVSCSS
jgi:hypothetical protein